MRTASSSLHKAPVEKGKSQCIIKPFKGGEGGTEKLGTKAVGSRVREGGGTAFVKETKQDSSEKEILFQSRGSI